MGPNPTLGLVPGWDGPNATQVPSPSYVYDYANGYAYG